MYALADETGADFGITYYFRGNECFATRYGFPGYTNPRWYFLRSLSLRTSKAFRLIVSQQGEAVVKEGGYRKHTFLEGLARPQVEYFEDSNKSVASKVTPATSWVPGANVAPEGNATVTPNRPELVWLVLTKK